MEYSRISFHSLLDESIDVSVGRIAARLTAFYTRRVSLTHAADATDITNRTVLYCCKGSLCISSFSLLQILGFACSHAGIIHALQEHCPWATCNKNELD